jgi:hypothetical protein
MAAFTVWHNTFRLSPSSEMTYCIPNFKDIDEATLSFPRVSCQYYLGRQCHTPRKDRATRKITINSAPWPHTRSSTSFVDTNGGVLWDSRLTYSDARVWVCCLDQLLALVTNDPVGVNLCGTLGVQGYHLEVPEVSLTNGIVLRTHIINVWDTVVVKVVFTDITPPITCSQGTNKNKDTTWWLATVLPKQEKRAQDFLMPGTEHFAVTFGSRLCRCSNI